MKQFLLSFLFILVANVHVSAQEVYVTDTGTKYHTSTCQHLSKSKHAMKLSEAKSEGYEPCKVCKPAGQSAPTSTSVSRQCSGTTKAGNRCKRMTTSANGRCYQH